MNAIAKRIVLRLDPARPGDGGLAAIARLAAALHAELAARMIADTRVQTALAFQALSVKTPSRSVNAGGQMRRAEAGWRHAISSLADREKAAWSFDVVHCTGVLTRECAMTCDDIVALELPRLETSLVDLRDEIAEALTHACGVILFPSETHAANGPVAAIVGDIDKAHLLAVSKDIAAALRAPLRTVEHDGQKLGKHSADRREIGDIATQIRRLGATLAVVAAADPLVEKFLARPRYLRELATPLLLLKA